MFASHLHHRPSNTARERGRHAELKAQGPPSSPIGDFDAKSCPLAGVVRRNRAGVVFFDLVYLGEGGSEQKIYVEEQKKV